VNNKHKWGAQNRIYWDIQRTTSSMSTLHLHDYIVVLNSSTQIPTTYPARRNIQLTYATEIFRNKINKTQTSLSCRCIGSSLSWPGDNQQQLFPAIVVADGGKQQQLSLLVSLSFSWKTPAIAPD
jgi:hypothetical protein